MKERRASRRVNVGGVPIGGDAPVTIQSMTNTDTRDVEATLRQIEALADSGCQIVRVAVPDEEAASALSRIVKESRIPVVADIHFDYRLALKSIDAGAAKLRINPGNIGDLWKVREVVRAAKDKGIPIRVGVNSGSLDKEILEKYSAPTPRALAESAKKHVRILEDMDFRDIVISVKSSDVIKCIEAYRILADETDYPLHIGVTEAGGGSAAIVKSSIGIGVLLWHGIGDTLRVSLTGDPLEEVYVGQAILRSLGLTDQGLDLVSCPTCGRCGVDLESLAERVRRRAESMKLSLKIAVMGCAVNGPGEARDADYGIACGKGSGVVFRKGEIVGRGSEDELEDMLFDIIRLDLGL